MFNKRKLYKFFFDTLTQSIYRTPPAKCDPKSKFVVLSQTFHRDISMYLIAAKSFGQYLQPNAFVVVDDGLTNSDRSIIRDHLEKVQFIKTGDVDTRSCPRGACWERLIAIEEFCKTGFVIQLDADTVTTRQPDSVESCVKDARCFTLSTKQGTDFVSVAEAASFAKEVNSTHVQILTERVLSELPDAESRRYIRGCAGFAGFSKGSLDIRKIESFSNFMEKRLGRAVWHKWGSEQATSNYMIANTDNPRALPLAKYPYWSPETDLSQAELVHFIGEHRFTSTMYMRIAKQAIESLGDKPGR